MHDLRSIIKKLEKIPITRVHSHSNRCCEIARTYIIYLDLSLMQDSDPMEPPTWLRARYEWKPVKHPVFWCQIPSMEGMDCGLFAAVTREIYKARGVYTLPVQMILKYPSYVSKHWISLWRKSNLNANWVVGEYVYHEAVAILCSEYEVKIYDPTLNVYVRPGKHLDRATVVAIKILAENDRLCAHVFLSWDGKWTKLNEWVILSEQLRYCRDTGR